MAEREEQGPVALPDRPAEALIREGAESLGIPLGSGELEHYAAYVRELLDWNQRMNLTAVTDAREIAVKHILDSLTCFLAISAGKGVRALDIGTGAGFPGMVLKIHAPEMPLTLLDSTRKKLDFLEHLAQTLVSPAWRRCTPAPRMPGATVATASGLTW